MNPVVLQCAAADWTAANFHTCIFGEAVSSLGSEPLFGLLVWGAVALAFYVAGGGDAVTPAVFSVLVASFGLAVLPAGVQSIAWAVMFIGMVAALVAVAQKYVINPTVT